ncbi:protein kinase domain-containing protein [Colletotrichum kahawae]|uniref:Protein kinase domain-containing protein n=1 Tax=Colletotrichum kahawae TaxID=34407 RepID=A0AAD9YAD8_COLKA|nr:protein kinase domain-containing protein [Colletotrichum kahawae]
MDIETRILDGIVEAADGAEFLPVDVIDQLAAPRSVRDHLHANYEDPSNAANIESLVSYVTDKSNPAKRVFLTLVYCGQLHNLSLLQQAGFQDTDLPIEKTWDKTSKSYHVYSKEITQSPLSGRKLWKCFYDWKNRRDVEAFDDKQWYFIAPVFVTGVFDYRISPKCPLLIMEKSIPSKKMGYSALRIIYDMKHPHLIQPLAAYTWGDQSGFLFPWAEALHQQNLRPTDLKPSNILVFHDGDLPGTLRISNFGFVKIHQGMTQYRHAITSAKTGSMRSKALNGFIGHIDRFWEGTDDKPQQHPGVKRLIEEMRRHLNKDGPQASLAKCLDLVATSMLVPDWTLHHDNGSYDGLSDSSDDLLDSLFSKVSLALTSASSQPSVTVDPDLSDELAQFLLRDEQIRGAAALAADLPKVVPEGNYVFMLSLGAASLPEIVIYSSLYRDSAKITLPSTQLL